VLIERKWKKWVYFYLPMALFILFTLFPFYWMAVTAFRPDGELYRTWRQANATPTQLDCWGWRAAGGRGALPKTERAGPEGESWKR